MKEKVLQTNNGIVICDSIVMSVKKKRPDLRRAEAVVIAVIGFTAAIMSFLGMFRFRYDEAKFIFFAVLLSVIHIIFSLMGKKGSWLILGSTVLWGAAAVKMRDSIAEGFKYINDIIYMDSYHTEIQYYKYLRPSHERAAVTLFFIFCLWLLAITIYFFTISHPNPLLPLLVTFPLLETGLYNGIKISVFWGTLTVGYWLAVLSMSSTDVGEFSGGNGGFVRKDNTFFPKRNMRLKVTEKCALYVLAAVMMIAGAGQAYINLTDYKRSDALNEKREKIRDAMNEFTVEDLAESMSKLTSAFGFTFNTDSHKLGNTGRLKFKNTTDLVVTFDQKYDGAVYLKDYTGAVYGDNEWKDLSSSAYKSGIISDSSKYGIHPQDYPAMFTKASDPDTADITVWIKSKLKEDRSFSPYGVENYGGLTYNKDLDLTSKKKHDKEYSYKCVSVTADKAAEKLGYEYTDEYSAGYIRDGDWADRVNGYCSENGLYTYDDVFEVSSPLSIFSKDLLYANGHMILGQLLESKYRDFVYDNYLKVPDDRDMKEVREAFSDILDKAEYAETAEEKIALMRELRSRVEENSQYSLSPGKTPSNRDFVNYFLLENHKGYCIHYATSGVILARMAGIPARYATGYIIVGDDFNDASLENDGSYKIDVKDSRSHAWVELYLDGFGWVPFEFTAGYSSTSVSAATTTTTTAPQTTTATTTTTTASQTGDATTTRRSQQKTTASTANGTAKTTTAVKTTVIPAGTVKDHHKPMPPALKYSLYSALIIAGAAGFVLLRRKLILDKRKREFTEGANSVRAGNMYAYAEKLLSCADQNKNGRGFKDFAEDTEKAVSGELFRSGEFSKFMDIALRAGFSPSEPENEEIDFCQAFVNDLSGNVYSRSGTLGKLVMKFVTVLDQGGKK